ncbi:MAG TPA: hypothetical protein VGM04_00045 [Sphingomicrobium sp.]
MPDGVETLDASAILAREAIRASWSNRSDIYSDWFRYEIQKRALGTWLDLDMYLVAPLDLDPPNLFGEYEPGKINGAVLRLPPESPMLPKLLEQFEEKTIPTSMPFKRRLELGARRLIHDRVDLTRTPWGTTGPFALTEFVPKFGLGSEALPPEVFYPAPWQKAAWIADATVALEDFVTERTVAVHLWNELIKGIKNSPAPERSFLSRLQREGRE